MWGKDLCNFSSIVNIKINKIIDWIKHLAKVFFSFTLVKTVIEIGQAITAVKMVYKVTKFVASLMLSILVSQNNKEKLPAETPRVVEELCGDLQEEFQQMKERGVSDKLISRVTLLVRFMCEALVTAVTLWHLLTTKAKKG
ncbi:MAG: hypothetical protein F6J93_32575 [Oscillatoria sp. SIO1A7]|nr:hypothetical protein [Oscillatoria sp. SIO1A7]